MNSPNSKTQIALSSSVGWEIQHWYNLIILVGLICFGGVLFLSVGFDIKLHEVSGQGMTALTVVAPFGLGIVSAIGFFIAVIFHLFGKFDLFWKSLFSINYGLSLIGYSVFGLEDGTSSIQLVVASGLGAVFAGLWFRIGLIKFNFVLIPVGVAVFVPALFGLVSFGCGWLLFFANLMNLVWNRREGEEEAKGRSRS